MTEANHKGVNANNLSGTGLADGVHPVYIDLRDFESTDFRVTQDGGSGSISFTISVSIEPVGDTAPASLTYDNIGESFYGNTGGVFSNATELLVDDFGKLKGATQLKIEFTVSGASADASYSILQFLATSGAV
jgi:hypothetical protein